MTLSVDIAHDFGGFRLDVAFDAPPGVTALFGHSGAGKTSVANAIAGLLRVDRATISVAGRLLQGPGVLTPIHRRRIGYVFQDARLFPHLLVRQNLTFGARSDGSLAHVTELLGIAGLLERRVHGLSGGEAQRVAIGRALMTEPDLLIMDEPLASLDPARKAAILPYLGRLRDELRLPILYVSHALDEIAQLATTLVILSEGRVAAAGPVGDLLSDPALAPLIGVRGVGALVEARVARHHADGLTELATPGGALFVPTLDAEPGQPVRFRVEAQDVMLARARPEGISALNVLEGRIVRLRPGDGPGVLVAIDAGGVRLLARITQRSAQAMALAEGQSIYAVIKTVAVAPGNIAPAGHPAPSGASAAAGGA